jgi:putative transcription factor
MQCDMCGASGTLFKASIEGAALTVCKRCSRFGKVLHTVKEPEVKARPKKTEQPEKVERIADDYAEKIRRKREQKGMTQEEFAHRLSERVSVITHLEAGKFKPSERLSKKLERFLGVKLIEQYEESAPVRTKTRSDTFTLGDFIKIKKKGDGSPK